MLRVPIKQAAAGMQLALPVRHPTSAATLLTRDYTLDETTIVRLIELGVPEIWIHYPGTELIETCVSPMIVENQGRLVHTVASMFEHLHREAHTPLEYNAYRQNLRELIESLVAEPAAASYIVETSLYAASELRHASAVCFLSVLLGLKLQGYLVQQRKRLKPGHAQNVTSLGLGAMLHDVGFTRLDPAVRARYIQTRDQSDPAWRRHVTMGHQMITGHVEPAAAGVVLHHHQHFDGSGFPLRPDPAALNESELRGLAGSDIHVFARIVCLADHVDRLRFGGDGDVSPRVRVLRQLLCSPLAARFDPVVLAALPSVFPAYPPGSVVRLNTNQSAVILSWDALDPCRPTIQILPTEAEAARQRRDPPVIDLRIAPHITIAEQDGHDVATDNFTLPKSLIPRDAATYT